MTGRDERFALAGGVRGETPLLVNRLHPVFAAEPVGADLASLPDTALMAMTRRFRAELSDISDFDKHGGTAAADTPRHGIARGNAPFHPDSARNDNQNKNCCGRASRGPQRSQE